MSERRRVVIMGAAGRDFHNFNTVLRGDPSVEVVAFTATQIPGIDRRVYPPELAGSHYPQGIPIIPEHELDDLLGRRRIDAVIFSYSDVAHEYVMHEASRVLASGSDFTLLGPRGTMVDARVPVISVCAVRTGAGKSQTSRFVADLLLRKGLRPAIIRHPMPYGDLLEQRVQRFEKLEDLDRHHTTVEEREEYEPHIRRGLVVWAGVDYEEVVRGAEREASIIIWDGGNNDFSFVEPQLEIVVADPFRAGHEVSYHPGEVNVRRADIVVINKVNTAPPGSVDRVAAAVREVNPAAVVVRANSVITAPGGTELEGKRVLVVEDGPTLTHGGMATGAGAEAARRFGAAELVDPRPYALGRLADVYAEYPHLGPILPAVGYFEDQLRDLEATIAAVPADMVVIATPFAIDRLVSINRPLVRVAYELEEAEPPRLSDQVHAFLQRTGVL